MVIKQLIPIVPTQPKWSGTETMQALTYQNKKVQVTYHPKPLITHPRDAIVKITSCTICGSDLHLSKGNVINTHTGEIFGHEGCGVIEHLGDDVKNFKVGDRVAISAIIACGECDFCHMKKFSNCNNTSDSAMFDNMVGGSTSGIFGYSGLTGNYPGLQAEYARVPLCDVNLLKLPEEVTDEEAVLLSDVLPTAYQGVLFAEFGADEFHQNLVIFGAGPIGLMAAYLARKLFNGKQIVLVDPNSDRLEVARSLNCDILTIQGTAKSTDVDLEDRIMELLGGRRPDSVIDATGFDYSTSWIEKLEIKTGFLNATESLNAAIKLCRKSGTVSISGVYSGFGAINLAAVMNKALVLRSGQLHVQAYWEDLLQDIIDKKIDVKWMVSTILPLSEAVKGYADFENKKEGVLKVCLKP